MGGPRLIGVPPQHHRSPAQVGVNASSETHSRNQQKQQTYRAGTRLHSPGLGRPPTPHWCVGGLPHLAFTGCLQGQHRWTHVSVNAESKKLVISAPKQALCLPRGKRSAKPAVG